MKKFFTLFTAAIAAVMPLQAAEWMTDFEQAKAKAKQENKVILADFTGSDWCHFCIVLRRRVLDTPAFEEYGADKFVYLEVDLPRTTRLPEALWKQNNTLVSEYKVGGFPTVIVIDAEGHALGGFTGGMTRFQDVVKALEPALAVHRHLLAAESAPENQRAAHWAEAYRAYPDNYRRFNSWLRERMETADPADATRWRVVFAAEQQMAALEAELSQHIMNRAAMLACYDRYLAEAVEGNRTRILRLKELYLNGVASRKMNTARTVEDILEVRDLQLQAAECVPDPTERAAQIERIREVFAQPETLLPGNKKSYNMR